MLHIASTVNSLNVFCMFSQFFCVCRFSQGLRLRQVDLIQENVALSSRTLTKMSAKLRSVCTSSVRRLERRTGRRIGGRNSFIVIDESKFCHKRKVRVELAMLSNSVPIHMNCMHVNNTKLECVD